jgi:hypothetical protein
MGKQAWRHGEDEGAGCGGPRSYSGSHRDRQEGAGAFPAISDKGAQTASQAAVPASLLARAFAAAGLEARAIQSPAKEDGTIQELRTSTSALRWTTFAANDRVPRPATRSRERSERLSGVGGLSGTISATGSSARYEPIELWLPSHAANIESEGARCGAKRRVVRRQLW